MALFGVLSIVYQLVPGNTTSKRGNSIHLATGTPVSACVLFFTIANIFLHQKSEL